MTRRWTTHELERLGSVRELEVSAPRSDGSWTRWTPIWVVVAGDGVFVRTWYPRTTGWYGRAVATGRARFRATGIEVVVVVQTVGDPAVDAAGSAAYRSKYGDAGAGSMVTEEAEATTLRLVPGEA